MGINLILFALLKKTDNSGQIVRSFGYHGVMALFVGIVLISMIIWAIALFRYKFLSPDKVVTSFTFKYNIGLIKR